MSFGTAHARLDRDLLFMLAVGAGHRCHRCGDALTRETFSVEHKKPWAAQPDPKAAFFDLSNIAFSHASCNQLEMAARKRLPGTPYSRTKAYFAKRWSDKPVKTRRAERKARYALYGC